MNDLKKYAGLLNDIAPEGEFLAYINKDESDLLKSKGAKGLLTPQGIPSYRGEGGYQGGSSSSSSSSSGGSSSSSGGSSSSSGGGGGGGGGRDYSSVPASTPSTKPSAPPGGGSTSLGSGRDYSPPSSSIGGNDNTVDPGFQRALTEIAYQQQNPALGDPDPYVDTPISERDTITSFLDNYAANVKSNPLMLGTLGALKTLYQTEKAKGMMEGQPGYEFLNYSDGGSAISNIIGGDGGGDNNVQNLLSNIFSQITPDSMVNKYFANMGTNQGSPLSSDLQTSYNNAKNSVNSILGMTPTNQQFGYSAQPYGLLSSTNMANNPYNIPYLQQRGLI
jgi:hypothetical protein